MRNIILVSIFTVILSSVAYAGTIVTNFNPLGSITFSSGTIAPITLITTGSGYENNVTASTNTLAMNCTGANFLVAIPCAYGASVVSGGSSVTDSSHNVWTALTDVTNSGRYTGIWYSSSAVVTSTLTITATNGGGTTYIALVAACYSLVASSPFDVQNSSTSAAIVSTIQTNSVTPSVNNELLITGACMSNSETASVNSGFTTEVNSSVSGSELVYLGDLIQTTATAENPTWTLTSADAVSAAIATFK